MHILKHTIGTCIGGVVIDELSSTDIYTYTKLILQGYFQLFGKAIARAETLCLYVGALPVLPAATATET